MSGPPPGYFVEVRDPHTQKLVCRVNPHTGEVVTVGRGGDIRRGTLPPLCLPPCEARSEGAQPGQIGRSLDKSERVG